MVSRRTFIKNSAIVAAAATVTPSIIGGMNINHESDSLTPLQGKRILYILGGRTGHGNDNYNDILIPWMKSEGASVTVAGVNDAFINHDLKNEFDLIIQSWTMGSMPLSHEKILLEAVKNGVGFAGWYGGLGDTFHNNKEFQTMVGAHWFANPGKVMDYRVNILSRKDPVTRGVSDFNMRSAQYYIHTDQDIKVLATTSFAGKNASLKKGNPIPVIWQKFYGNGRVFYSSMGHTSKDFEVPEALEIQKRGVRWAAMGKSGLI